MLRPPAIAITALLTLAACSADVDVTVPDGPAPTATQSPAASPGPTTQVFDEIEYTVTLPRGWVRTGTVDGMDASKAVRYDGPSSEFFVVAMDPQGSDSRYDALWRYRWDGDSFEVVDRSRCHFDDRYCSDGDQRFDAYVLAQDDPPTLGGHTYYFWFGNEAAETLDESLFTTILGSVEPKGA